MKLIFCLKRNIKGFFKLDVCGQACPNYTKYKASYSFAISYEKSE